MKKIMTGFAIAVCQLLVVSFFCSTTFNKNMKVEKYVSTVHNENLNKIAESVTMLFETEKVESVDTEEAMLDDFIVADLPTIDVVKKEEDNQQEAVVKKDEIVSTPLVSVDASKYTGNDAMGFHVTEGNKNYSLSGNEFDVVVAVVSGEFDKNLNDALGVVSVILNRCDSDKWRRWAGDTPYKQVIKSGQFEVYFAGGYKKYMPGGAYYGSEKYNIARQAVIDGLNGIRNNEYLGFRAWWITSYSDKYIVYGGNRYAYN